MSPIHDRFNLAIMSNIAYVTKLGLSLIVVASHKRFVLTKFIRSCVIVDYFPKVVCCWWSNDSLFLSWMNLPVTKVKYFFGTWASSSFGITMVLMFFRLAEDARPTHPIDILASWFVSRHFALSELVVFFGGDVLLLPQIGTWSLVLFGELHASCQTMLHMAFKMSLFLSSKASNLLSRPPSSNYNSIYRFNRLQISIDNVYKHYDEGCTIWTTFILSFRDHIFLVISMSPVELLSWQKKCMFLQLANESVYRNVILWSKQYFVLLLLLQKNWHSKVILCAKVLWMIFQWRFGFFGSIVLSPYSFRFSKFARPINQITVQLMAISVKNQQNQERGCMHKLLVAMSESTVICGFRCHSKWFGSKPGKLLHFQMCDVQIHGTTTHEITLIFIQKMSIIKMYYWCQFWKKFASQNMLISCMKL